MKLIYVLIALFSFTQLNFSFGQTGAAKEQLTIHRVATNKKYAAAYGGDLKNGTVLSSLDWASAKEVGCFAKNLGNRFNGNTIFYVTELEPNTSMTISLVPDDPKKDMSVYAYSIGIVEQGMPPKLTKCHSCEARHAPDPKLGEANSHWRRVKLRSGNDPQKIVVGVAGAEGLKEGTFAIQFEVK